MNIDINLEPRQDLPRRIVYLLPALTVLAALVVSSFALVALGFNPVVAYNVMFVETLTTEYGITETLVEAVPLVLTGLAVYIPLRAGLWNVGAEGQLFVGAVAGTWLGLTFNLGVATLPVMLVGAMLAGLVWGAIPGYLLSRFDVNEILTTLMMTFIAIEFTGYLIRGPMQAEGGSFPVTDSLSATAMLPSVAGVHAGVLLTAIATVGVYILLTKTVIGYEISVTGSNPDTATQAGINTFWINIMVLSLGGAIGAIAGISEIAGAHGQLIPDFSPGYGFTAIAIAVLGRNGAWQVALAGLFFAVLFVGGSSMEISHGVPSAIVDVIVALVILFLITAEFFKRYELSVGIEREREANDGPRKQSIGGNN